ncbi:HlyD family secretion protein [Aeromonas veronii]|uniref:HlyD family secretion protein n=1 Tax=Aeromonas veronii TaxID=654 RepID=UPI0018F249C7|nr:efflux RND transporter periplasmic adaptor subunit [Aeromonas veronii]MBJ7590527.1 efflux RND transporter periplasmic adaptor subunit [Aeromonas veronii]
MKEILLPYILIVWLLVKLNILPWNLKTGFWSTAIGALLALGLLTTYRHLAPVDFTDSATVKAPHAVLGPLLGINQFHQIDQIYVAHNQRVARGQPIYSLADWESNGKSQALSYQIDAQHAQVASEVSQQRAIQSRLNLNHKELARLTQLGNFASIQSRDQLQTQIDGDLAQLSASEAKVQAIEAQVLNLETELALQERRNEEKVIRAPFDGQVSIVNIASGSRTGNMHLYDTSRKFLEFRIPDQSFRNIAPGQFAEFYVDAYPGRIFRARVHSVLTGTGEAQMSVAQGDQDVRQHVGNNMSSHGRTVVLDMLAPDGVDLPIGATGSAWISAHKPHPLLGFIDIIGAATVRLKAMKAYLFAM